MDKNMPRKRQKNEPNHRLKFWLKRTTRLVSYLEQRLLKPAHWYQDTWLTCKIVQDCACKNFKQTLRWLQ